MLRLVCLFAAGLAGLSLTLTSGCNEHPVVNFAQGPFIDDLGISVPVPPPSLTAAPVQRVDIEGQLASANPEPKTVVYLQDAYGDLGVFVYAAPDGSFTFQGVEINLQENCLELWSEGPGPYGKESVHAFYQARIDDDDQTIRTTPLFRGC